MKTKEWIQEIISNELEYCFADCSQDNIDKWVEILERYHKQKLNLFGIGSKWLLSIKWKADQAKQHLDNMLEDIEHIQAACASGGEGKGVSDGDDIRLF